ncbi:MAG: hypothetical protein L6R30_27220, partial [Thermoanaerobaculia bacterium]|nr:hypothetical protein [Thermoanaerobaculia bacterium]
PSDLRYFEVQNAYAAIQIFDGAHILDHGTFGSNSGYIGAYKQTATLVRNCTFGNAGAASAAGLEATGNYWNDPSGPRTGGSGNGTLVGDTVRFDPWLTAPPAAGTEFNSIRSRNHVFNPAVGVPFVLDFTLSQSASWSVTFKDGNGGTMRTFSGNGTTASISWDGKDGSGILVAAGSYTYDVNAGTATARGRATLDPARAMTLTSWSATPAIFSPDGDGNGETTTLSATLSFPDSSLSMELRNGSGSLVAALPLPWLPYLWNGKDQQGSLIADGTYTATLLSVNGPASTSAATTVTIDTTPPSITITSPAQNQTYSNLTSGASLLIDVSASVQDANMCHWDLALGPGVDPTTWSGLGGWSTNASGLIVQINTANLSNGTYTLKFWAQDHAGHIVEVRRQFVLGNVTVSLSSQELRVASAGTITLTSILPVAATQTLTLVNEAGAVARTLVNGSRGAGTYTDTWDGKDGAGQRLPDGLYRWISTVNDGTNQITLDDSARMHTEYQFTGSGTVLGGDSFNNVPITGSYTNPYPAQVWFVYATVYHVLFGPSCDPPFFC